jgi:hypothetical protein
VLCGSFGADRSVAQALLVDKQRALQPDYVTPFSSLEDALKRLVPYHVFSGTVGGRKDPAAEAASQQKEASDCTGGKKSHLRLSFILFHAVPDSAADLF